MKYSVFLLLLFCCFAFTPFRKSIHAADETNTLTDRLNSIDSIIRNGKIVVIDYWFMGCAQCKKTIPDMDGIAREYAPKGVKVYGLNPIDDPAKVKTYHSTKGLFYTMYAITTEVAQKHYVYDYPTVVIYKNGKPALTIEGSSALLHQQITDKLNELLKK